MDIKRYQGLLWLVAGLLIALIVQFTSQPQWNSKVQRVPVTQDAQGQWTYTQGDTTTVISAQPYTQSPLHPDNLRQAATPPDVEQQWVLIAGEEKPVRLQAYSHQGMASLLPAFLAIVLCLVTREPLMALLGGVISAAILLGRFDLSSDVFIPALATESAAGILILYLWLLGGLMGIWGKTGAAQAFAELMTRRVVRGPRSAKLVTWLLGLIFFQGGTMSTVLVGTTVKPMADKANVSHEELSYVVDSTASPIAILIAFNAWPAYVQALIFVPGVTFLATEADRLSFFFASVPLSFYAVLAILSTFLLSLDKPWFCSAEMRQAMQRARRGEGLNRPDAQPLSAKELHAVTPPADYASHWGEFVWPLVTLIVVAIGTFMFNDSPQIHWAFGAALLLATIMAMVKGMGLRQVMEGFANGWKGVVVASVVLMLAITLGGLSKELGGGNYLVQLLGDKLPFWCLPVLLQWLTMVIAFSTGTSWGTYAVAFPLAMPLVWAVAQSQGVANPELLMMLCFAAVLNGSVYGDQCSPISDTTILSAMTTGCDLMDHVRTQWVPATFAAVGASVLWTGCALVWV
ncbi:sodium:proton antiporter [Aestuariibacter halophilus]|uniref:Sodium:proton antiporter n=1 Tax=Fluctibacter halophilus TaxID=226011 RepID=A0ABS8GBU9_9ALTE|nr:Na+/H+ antiporter NhaC family protein [Aestuariibacter halophilus]MCC2617884.1 sodium:proton antiporter [Aestuariibacter halophilus]